jgi:hypothetical protein
MKGGDELTKTRFMYLLLIASLLAYFLACAHGHGGIFGMSDGGGLMR